MNYSVLCSVYKNENPQFFKAALLSIINQTEITNDFVIVEDGPLTQSLYAIIDDFVLRYPFINVVKISENVGLGRALNHGLSKCKNELVARMDSDDISFLDRMEKQLKCFREYPNLDLVGSYMQEFIADPDSPISIKRVPITSDMIYMYGKRRNPFNHPTVMYKKSSVINVGGYSDRRRGQDFELFGRMLVNGCKGINIPEPLLKFRSNSLMIKRRKSVETTQNYFSIIWEFYNLGYSSFFDWLVSFIFQLGIFIMPCFLVSFFRKMSQLKINRKQ